MVSDIEARRNIASNLRRILQERGISQVKLAALTGECEMTISRVIRGTNTPGVALIARIADALDVSMDRLVEKPAERNLSATA